MVSLTPIVVWEYWCLTWSWCRWGGWCRFWSSRFWKWLQVCLESTNEGSVAGTGRGRCCLPGSMSTHTQSDRDSESHLITWFTTWDDQWIVLLGRSWIFFVQVHSVVCLLLPSFIAVNTLFGLDVALEQEDGSLKNSRECCRRILEWKPCGSLKRLVNNSFT